MNLDRAILNSINLHLASTLPHQSLGEGGEGDFRTLSVFYIDAIYIQLIVTRKWCLKKFTIITDIYAIYRLYNIPLIANKSTRE